MWRMPKPRVMKTSAVLIIVLLFSVFSCEPFYLCPNGNCDDDDVDIYRPKDRDFNADLVFSQSPTILPYEVKTSDQLPFFIPKQFDVTGTSSYTGALGDLSRANLDQPYYNDACRCAKGSFSLLLNGSSTIKLYGGYILYAKPNATHVFWISNNSINKDYDIVRAASVTLEGPFDGKVYRLRGKGHINY